MLQKLFIYITVDSVQHAPHAVMDLSELDIDGINFAPYKFFGVRGFGLHGIVRVSPLHCHNLEEVETYLKVTQELTSL